MDPDDEDSVSTKPSYADLIAAGIIHFVLSLHIVSYAVLLLHLVQNGTFTCETGLWTIILYATITKLTTPIFKSYKKFNRLFVILSTFFLSSVIAFTSLCTKAGVVIILFGAFSAIFINCIKAQVHLTVDQKILEQLMQACCLLITPNACLAVSNFLLLVLAAIVLLIIPTTFLLGRKKLPKIEETVQKHFELTNIVHQPETESSSSEEELVPDEPDEVFDQIHYEIVGGKVLADIPEESEDEDKISYYRLSRISAILQGLNNSERNLNLSINNLFIPNETMEEDVIEEEINQKEKKECCQINTKYVEFCRNYRRRLKSLGLKWIKRTMPRVLSTIYFYPVLLTSCVTTICPSIVLASTPYIFGSRIKRSGETESVLLLTIMGFSWLFFLTTYPIINKMSAATTKSLFIAGLAILGLSLFFVHEIDGGEKNLVFFALTFGLGHGITIYCEQFTHKLFCGQEKIWKLLEDPLEICTGFIVILVYLGFYVSSLSFEDVLKYAYFGYFGLGLLWILLYVVQAIWKRCRHSRRYNLHQLIDEN